MFRRQDLKDVTYLEDGLYIAHDGWQFWMFTSNGIVDSNFVAFEYHVTKQIMSYCKKHKQETKHDLFPPDIEAMNALESAYEYINFEDNKGEKEEQIMQQIKQAIQRLKGE